MRKTNRKFKRGPRKGKTVYVGKGGRQFSSKQKKGMKKGGRK